MRRRGAFELRLPSNTAVTADPAIPSLADYDGDLLPDLITPLAGSDRLLFAGNVFAGNHTASVRYSEVHLVGHSGDAVPQPGELAHISLYLLHGEVPAEATEIEVHAFSWDVAGGGAPTFQPMWGSRTPCTPTAPPYLVSTAKFDASYLYDGAVALLLRYAARQPNGDVQVWPPNLVAVSVSDPIYGALLNLPGFNESLGGIGGVPTGGVTTVTRLPPVEPPIGLVDDKQ